MLSSGMHLQCFHRYPYSGCPATDPRPIGLSSNAVGRGRRRIHCFPLIEEMLVSKIVIVFHSGYGHTKKLAEAVHQGAQHAGAEVTLLPVAEVNDAAWAALEAADAIIFGAPTYMGGPSADFKKFADASSKPWFAQKWKDKIAAGFTNSATMNGDTF